MRGNFSVEELEIFMRRQAEADEFSGAVLIARDAKSIFEEAYGLASKRFNIPNRVDTRFNIGSLNKMFTKVAVTQLAEQGKLSFNDYIRQHLPDYPPEISNKVTIRHLLDHTSGMGHYWNEKFEASKSRLRTVDDFLRLFIDEPLSFEPGEKFQYSNAGYVVLGKIVEVASRQDYYDYMRERIYKPAGMNDTGHYEMDIPVPNLAIGYTRTGSEGRLETGLRRENTFLVGLKGSPAGGGYSTVEDLLKFYIALRSYKLLSPKYTDIVLPDTRTPDKEKKRVTSLAGGAPGVAAIFEMYHGLGYTVIILSNYDTPTVEPVRKKISEMIISK